MCESGIMQYSSITLTTIFANYSIILADYYPLLTALQTISHEFIPSKGTNSSHRGKKKFPPWEHFLPTVGILSLLRVESWFTLSKVLVHSV